MGNSQVKITTDRPHDPGPIYKETDMGRFPVEPYSVVSNLLFLLICVYLAVKTKLNFRQFPLLATAAPLLFVGWFGGTIYHATRSSYVWLVMDYMPILLLCLMAAIFLWRQLVGNWLLVLLCAAGPAVGFRIMLKILRVSLAHHPSEETRGWFIAIGYSVLAASIVLPAALHCVLKYRKGWKWLTLALACFALAIAARQFDNNGFANPLPMGTHFLWHVFGAASAFCLIKYLYPVEKMAAAEK